MRMNLKEIQAIIGKKHKNHKEYNRFRYQAQHSEGLKIMKRRHLAHTGPASINRRPCIYCG